MQTIAGTRPWYIRCIKPNDKNVPDELNPDRLLQQLRYGGVLEAVRVSRAGYPCRIEHNDFIIKFGSMVTGIQNLNKSNSEKCQLILKNAKLDQRDSQVGLTKVFLRQEAYDRIEAWRWRRMNIAATVVQCRTRGRTQRVVYRHNLTLLYRAVLLIKRWIHRRHLKCIRRKAAVRTIARFCRTDFKHFLVRGQAATCIQCCIRIMLSRRAKNIRIAAYFQAIEDSKLSNQVKILQLELADARAIISNLGRTGEQKIDGDESGGGGGGGGGGTVNIMAELQATNENLLLTNEQLSQLNSTLQVEMNSALEENTRLQEQLGSNVHPAPRKEHAVIVASEHLRRYSPKPKNAEISHPVRAGSLENIDAAHADLLQANEFLVLANRHLMTKMSESTQALAESTSRNESLMVKIAALESEPQVEQLSARVEELKEELEQRPVLGDEDTVKLATDNRMLKARVEMQAQLNTALAIECEELRREQTLMSQVRDIITPTRSRKKKNKR